MSTETEVKVNARWDNALVPAGETCSRSLLIEVTAPPKPEPIKERPPINLALVIDRSGSMSGGLGRARDSASPMEAAKSAAIGIAQGLNEGDRLSVVTFDSTVEMVFAGLAMDQRGKVEAETMISRIETRGMTDLAGGWFEGARCVADMCERQGFAEGHVLVLSDGHANQGICEPGQLAKHATELAERGIKTSAVGIGNNYSPLQLDALAEGGQGRLHDAETTEDIIDVVLGELGELHAITARDVQLTLRHPELANVDVLTRAPAHQGVRKQRVRLGDIVGDGVRPVAVRVELPKLIDGEKLEFGLAVRWKTTAGDAEYRQIDSCATLTVVPRQEAAAAEVDTEVLRQVADLWEAKLAYEAMQHNERGDYVAACASYDDVMPSFAAVADKLDDGADRMARFESVQRRVGREWQGRSKRESMVMSKKTMLRERDLRGRDRGDWHDHIDE